MNKKQKNVWSEMKDDRGDIGLHLPAGKVYVDGFLTSSTSLIYFPIVAFINENTGEVKIFLRRVVEKFGRDNLKL